MNSDSTILDNISTPVFVTQPIYNQNRELIDFQIIYTNKAMKELSKQSFIVGAKWTDIKNKVPAQVPWYKLLVEAVTKKP